MPKTDPVLAEMIEETRASLREVIAALADAGIRNHWVAEAAGWSPGFLSQALGENPTRVPGPQKVRDMVRGLSLVAGATRLDDGWRVALEPVAERYGVAISEPAPPIGFIREDSSLFVHRHEIERFLDNYASEPGVFLLGGSPMVGLTTALKTVTRRIREQGRHVVEVSVKRNLVDSGWLPRAAAPRVASALAAAVQGDDSGGVLELGSAAFGFFRERFRAYPQGLALVIDELDALPEGDRQALVALLRDWRERQADRDPGYGRLAVWAAWTSDLDIQDSRDRSWFQASDTKAFDWFSEGEIEAVVERYIPVAIGSGVWRPDSKANSKSRPSAQARKLPKELPRDEWISHVTASVMAHFAGQPQLTHQFIYELVTNRSIYSTEGADELSGVYKTHVERLCDALIGLFGASGASEVVGLVNTRKPLPVIYAYATNSQVGIVGSNSGWRSDFYARHVPNMLSKRLASLARRQQRRPDR